MRDAFLEEQLELLRKLNERVAQIQDNVSQNVELVEQHRRAAERWRAQERLYHPRGANSANDGSPQGTPRGTAADRRRGRRDLSRRAARKRGTAT